MIRDIKRGIKLKILTDLNHCTMGRGSPTAMQDSSHGLLCWMAESRGFSRKNGNCARRKSDRIWSGTQGCGDIHMHLQKLQGN